MEEKKSILILSGPVGAGKSTVARELVSSATGPIACIEGDTFWSFIIKSGVDQSRKKNFRMIMTSMIAAAMPYSLAGYEVILDFSIPPWFLETVGKIVKLREVPIDYIVLQPSEKVCAKRAAERKEGIISDYTDYHDLYLTFDEAGSNSIHDDTSDPASIAARIRKGLLSGLFRISI
jgi:hypothetical protein